MKTKIFRSPIRCKEGEKKVLWEQIQVDWKSCEDCGLAETAQTHVLGRGQIPCDVFLLGIGPGREEDEKGISFIGAAGEILDGLVEASKLKERRLFFGNLVACHPTDSLRGDNRNPTEDEIQACRNWLSRLLRLCKPKVIVFLGRLAQGFGPAAVFRAEIRPEPRVISTYHPSYILRSGGKRSEPYGILLADLRQAEQESHLPF